MHFSRHFETGIIDSVSSHVPSTLEFADILTPSITNSASYSEAFSLLHFTSVETANFDSNAF